MQADAAHLLKQGKRLVDPVMQAHGFAWEPMSAGRSSGGTFDSGRYVKGDRSLELHFRWSLGMVTYHIGKLSLSHEDYMRHVAPAGGSKYPGFSSDPMAAFRDLAEDLEKYCLDFLSGSGQVLQQAKGAADRHSKKPGF
jgi:hypothetical protein